MLPPQRIEVSVQLAVEHPEHVAVELGGDAGRVVVGRDQASRVLDEVGAEQQRVTREQGRREVVEQTSAIGGLVVADRAAEERNEPPAAGGDRAEVVVEVADDAVDLEAGVALGEVRGRPPEDALGHVERDEAPKLSARRERVEERARLVRRPRTELDERVGAGASGDRGRLRLEDRPLARGRVVLGQTA